MFLAPEPQFGGSFPFFFCPFGPEAPGRFKSNGLLVFPCYTGISPIGQAAIFPGQENIGRTHHILPLFSNHLHLFPENGKKKSAYSFKACFVQRKSSSQTQLQLLNVYLYEERRDAEDERGEPREQDGLLGLADGAQVLGLQRVHDGVIPVNHKEVNW